ncbi:hypothetical protein C6501_02925 [Candidatus Poribacteria bacterium]|nr:MAG: hypothetical protein C6501_02925 [Candidatus Poribacteria bacterium]
MKVVLLFTILFCAITVSAQGELTSDDLKQIRSIIEEKVDLDKIRLIVNDEIKKEIANSEERMKEYIDIKIESIEKRLMTYNWVIYVLTPLIVAAIGIPTAIMAWRGIKESNQDKRIEELTREIETLKQQRIVNP